jgi:hypothetical protein
MLDPVNRVRKEGRSIICRNVVAFKVSLKILKIVRFQVFAAASTKMPAFRDVAPCSLVEVYWRFGGACCVHHQDDLKNY